MPARVRVLGVALARLERNKTPLAAYLIAGKRVLPFERKQIPGIGVRL
jgi:hypothetical protein